MSPVPNLQTIVDATTQAIRRHAYLALAGAAAVIIALVLGAAWLSSGTTWWSAPSPAPLLLELLAIGAVGALVYWALARLRGDVSEGRVASAGEDAMGLPRGSVRGLLELSRQIPAGTSPALFQKAQSQLGGSLGGVTPDQFAGEIGVQVRRQKVQTLTVAGALLAVLVVAGFLAPALRGEVLLEWRAAGTVRHEETLTLTEGAGRGTIPTIDAVVRYWITAPDGAVSDTFTVRPLDPLLVSELTTEVIYPAYLGRPAEQFQTEVPSLEIPEGTELRIHGRATRVLGSAGLSADSGKRQEPLRAQGRRHGLQRTLGAVGERIV
jgi:hypothetical protein